MSMEWALESPLPEHTFNVYLPSKG
jgi:hypothetical protein